MDRKIFGMACFVLAIVIIVTSGASFAYYTSSANNDSTITGAVNNFDVDMILDTVYQANQLIPLDNSLVKAAISKSNNKCIDNRGYESCSLFTLTLKNNGDPQVLNGYITTSSSTYTTDNLKFQIYDVNFNPVTDVVSLSQKANNKTYFINNSNMVSTTLNSVDVVYYLVIWLTETGNVQNADYAKSFSGQVGFESISGEKLTASFSTKNNIL